MGARFNQLFVRGNQTAQVLLALALCVISIIRFTKTDRARRSRLDTWLIAVSLKSLVFLAYEVLTDNVLALRRFHSLKAVVVLNTIEAVFWVAGMAISVLSLKKGCSGVVCDLQGVSIIFVTLLFMIGARMMAFSILKFRQYKRTGVHPHSDVESFDFPMRTK